MEREARAERLSHDVSAENTAQRDVLTRAANDASRQLSDRAETAAAQWRERDEPSYDPDQTAVVYFKDHNLQRYVWPFELCRSFEVPRPIARYHKR